MRRAAGGSTPGRQTAILALQRAAGNAAVATLLRPPPAPGLVVQRVVERGLAHGTRVVWRGQEGTVAFATARGYEVRFLTTERPPIYYQLDIPLGELDLAAGGGAPAPAAASERSSQGEPGDDDSAMASDESLDEVAQDVLIEELPASVALSGVTLDDWRGGGDNWVLAPTGAHYPHLTLLGSNGELDRVHFTSAEGRADHVSVIRRGYRWNGMTSRLVPDPEFSQTEQRLVIKGRTATHLTFDLTGGRQNQQVAIGALHVAVPSVDAVANALGVRH